MCGMGQEYGSWRKDGMDMGKIVALAQEQKLPIFQYCNYEGVGLQKGGFYTWLDNNFCTKQWMGSSEEEDPGWCYVSKDCDQLNGGHGLEGSSVSLKLCREGEDTRMAELPPSQIVEGADKIEGDHGVALVLSYPQASVFWRDVEAFWFPDTGAPLTDANAAYLNKVMSSGQGYLFCKGLGSHSDSHACKGSGDKDYFVIKGQSVWEGETLKCWKNC